ncbi:MAG: DUF378 domain-containing protein [Candidatus Taylorbacteria bacterium]
MKATHCVASILVIVGALNWLLVAFNFNLVEAVCGTGSIARAVYILVGVSALVLVVTHKKHCKMCHAQGQTV